MNKFLQKLAKIFLGLSMAAGVGVAIGAGSKKPNGVNAAAVTYKLTIDANSFNTTSYAANNNEKTTNAVCTTDNTKTYSVKWTSNQVMKNSSNMQWQRNNGYIYNSTDLGTITGITVTSSAGSFTKYYGTSSHPTSGTTVGNGFFTVKVGNATGTTSRVEITFEVEEATNSVSVDLSTNSISIDLYTSTTASLTATATTTGSATKGLSAVSSNTSVATISTGSPTSGTAFTITGKAVGSATITVTSTWDNTTTATCSVTVTDTTPVPGPAIPTGDGLWIETAITSLTSTDTFVIVGNNGSTYAMSNDNGTGSAPSAVSVSVSDGKITSEVAERIMWNISGGTSPYTFYPASYTNKWLYCTNDNNGVRVGTGNAKEFTINSGYLYETGTTNPRYVGIYNSSDWRCYTSINSNIENQTFKFYKFVQAYSVTKNATNCTITGDTMISANENAVFTITPSTNYLAPSSVTVTRGGSAFSNYAYTVTNNVGTLTIPAAQITGAFVITAAATATYSVTGSITNGSLSVPGRISVGGTLDVTVVPTSGHKCPENSSDITVSNATIASYDNESGVIRLSNPTGNVTVTATCPAQGTTFTISTTVSNGTYTGDTEITDNGGVASVTIAPTGDYKLPTNVTVNGASYSYNSSTGVISLSNATSNVTINASMVALVEYTITVNETNGSHTGSSTIKESRTASLTFTHASGYGHPSSVTVNGATSSWDRNTGVLSLSNPSGNVTVTYVAVGNELDSITISTDEGNYTLGDPFVKPVVTAHYTIAADATVTTNATYFGYDPYTTGNQSVTISYTEGGITKTASYTAKVTAASVITTVTWNKVISTSDIAVGDVIIIADDTENVALSTEQRSNNRGAAAISKSNNQITWSDQLANEPQQLTLTSTSGIESAPTGSFGLSTGSGYLYAAASGSNHLKTQETNDVNGAFVITVSSGAAVISATASSNRPLMRSNYSNSPSVFSCYAANSTTGNGLEIYKKVTTQSGTADLIRITATYNGGEKYVGDSISTSDFTVKKQLNTGNNLIDVASGYTISAHTLTQESNTITVSYTEGGITKSVDVVVPATPRAVTLESVVLVEGEGVVKKYIDWSGTQWDYTGLTVQRIWSDETVESLSLATLIANEDASVSPAKPSVGVTSFTVSYEYLEVSISNATVSGITVVADYVSDISWTGTSESHFKAFSGGQLTAEQVGAWSVVPTLAGAGVQSALSFGSYTLKVGSKTISSLPYTWTSEDDGQELSITYGKDENGDDFVKKNNTARANICASINSIDHDETVTGDLEKTATLTKDAAIAIHTAAGVGDSAGVEVDHDIDTNIHLTGAKGSHASSVPVFWKDGLRVYAGNTLTFTPKNGATITSISLTSSGATCSAASGSSPWTISSGGGSAIVVTISNKTAPINSSIVVEYTIYGSETRTVHYANQMEHFDAQKKVVEFAKFMNTTMNGTNVCSGTFGNLESAWDDVADKYDELFGASSTLNSTELAWAKKMLQYANAIWGSEAEAACVEKAMKTYEFCVSHYELDPFMSGVRSVSAQQGSPLANIIGKNTNSVAIIVIISMVSVIAIGGYFFLRKRKENI